MESQMLAGRWVMPTVESNEDGIVRLHVSVAVENVESLAGQPVEVGLVAGGQQLPVREAPPPGEYYYLETLAVTAVADFAFDNPDRLAPEQVTVSLGGEQATWPLEPGPVPSDFPVA